MVGAAYPLWAGCQQLLQHPQHELLTITTAEKEVVGVVSCIGAFQAAAEWVLAQTIENDVDADRGGVT